MRKIVIAAIVLIALFVLYLDGSGWFVAHIASTILTVSDAREKWPDPTPSDPFELGYQGDPKTALGYDFEEVTVPTRTALQDQGRG